MTLAQLKQFLENLPENAIIMVEDTDAETVIIERHTDGRTHVIFTSAE